MKPATQPVTRFPDLGLKSCVHTHTSMANLKAEPLRRTMKPTLIAKPYIPKASCTRRHKVEPGHIRLGIGDYAEHLRPALDNILKK